MNVMTFRDWKLASLVTAAQAAVAWGRDPDLAMRRRAQEINADWEQMRAARRIFRRSSK